VTEGGATARDSREMSERETKMFQEAASAPILVESQLRANRTVAARIGTALRRRVPRAVVTAARGSSDNAATFAKYLIETRTATLTSSAGMSITSVYTASPKLDDVLFIAISQSGQSPDLLATAAAAKAAGAFVVALVNAVDSPLANLAHEVMPLHAGVEHSIAATKTYLASTAAIAQLVANWSEDLRLTECLSELPALMEKSWALDWSAAVTRLRSARDLYVIGRGLGFGAAQEAALKFKETCGLHAEAFSSADVRHGPRALVRGGFPVFVFSQNDETRTGIAELVASFTNANAEVLLAGFSQGNARSLPVLDAYPVLQPILMVQSFYRLANALSLARGFNPDHPPHLNKVTETV
jgi:glucosamine--fructose-6-phosphate aminotransferase (isomerizing)